MARVTAKTLEQLFARYRDAGDLAALASVFDAVAGELLLVAGHLVRDGVLAEDLLQTTFVEAMRAASRYDARRPASATRGSGTSTGRSGLSGR